MRERRAIDHLGPLHTLRSPRKPDVPGDPHNRLSSKVWLTSEGRAIIAFLMPTRVPRCASRKISTAACRTIGFSFCRGVSFDYVQKKPDAALDSGACGGPARTSRMLRGLESTRKWIEFMISGMGPSRPPAVMSVSVWDGLNLLRFHGRLNRRPKMGRGTAGVDATTPSAAALAPKMWKREPSLSYWPWTSPMTSKLICHCPVSMAHRQVNTVTPALYGQKSISHPVH